MNKFRKLLIETHGQVLEIIYVFTYFNLLINHKLRWPHRMAQNVITTMSSLSVIYVIILYNAREPNCRPNKLAHLLPEWLPKLSYSSRGIVYLVFLTQAVGSLSLRLMVCLYYLYGKRVYFSYSGFFLLTKNRDKTKEQKRKILVENFIKTKQLPACIERKDAQNLFLSTTLFWFKETFYVLDKIGIYVAIGTSLTFMSINLMLVTYYQHLNGLPIDESSPYSMDVVREPHKYPVIKFAKDLCHIKSDRLTNTIYIILALTVTIDYTLSTTFVGVLFILGVCIVVDWIKTIDKELEKLVEIRRREFLEKQLANIEVLETKHQRHHFHPSDSSFGDESLNMENDDLDHALPQIKTFIHDFPSINTYSKPGKAIGDSMAEYRRHRRGGIHQIDYNTNYQVARVDHHNEEEGEFVVRINFTRESDPIYLAHTNERPVTFSSSHAIELETKAGGVGFMDSNSTDLLELSIRNEILSLLFFIIDTDTYIAVISFVAIINSSFILIIFCIYHHKTNPIYDNAALYLLLFCGYTLLTCVIGLGAMANSGLLRLYKYVTLLIAYAPNSSEIRSFWNSLKEFWFTRQGLAYGYTVLGIVKASWPLYFQVLSWVSTVVLLTWNH